MLIDMNLSRNPLMTTHPFLSKRLENIKPSPTLAVAARAQQLKSQGVDVISLAAGEPDFDTPIPIKEAAIKAIHAGYTKYTAVDGILPLKKAIQSKLKKDHLLDYEINDIVVGTGGKQIIFNALMATINPGDKVIIPAPYWVSYPDMTTLFGGIPSFIEGRESKGFKVTIEQIEKAITPHTKWIILNSPSNPTGAMYSRQELLDIADCLRRHPHVLIMLDDIYECLVYDNNPCMNFATLAPDLKSRILIVNGVSKSHSMTGWRIGYGAGPSDMISAMTMIQSQCTSNPCSIAQHAAVEALTGDQAFLHGWREIFQQRRDLALSKINTIPGIHCMKPNGAFYLFINCEGVLGKKTPSHHFINDDNDFCLYLLDQAKVAAVPGSAFGMSPYFRISYVLDSDLLSKACGRIAEAVHMLV